MQHGAGNVSQDHCRRDDGVVGFLVDWDVARRAITLYQSTSISIRQ